MAYPTWDADTEYEPGKTVSFNNFYFRSLIINVGNPPGPVGSPWWKLLGPSIWSADLTYAPEMVVVSDKFFYSALISNNNNPPATSPTFWQLIGPAKLQGVIGVGGMQVQFYTPG